MIFYENRLPADDPHEMPSFLFLKKQQNLKLSSAANYRWPFMGYKVMCLLGLEHLLRLI